MTDWTGFAKEHHYLSDEWLEYIIKSDGIISDRGYKQICQNALDTRKQNKTLTAENERLRSALENIIDLVGKLIYKADGIYPLLVDTIQEVATEALLERK